MVREGLYIFYVIMPRVHLCKKVNFVKNVAYEVLSQQRRIQQTHNDVFF